MIELLKKLSDMRGISGFEHRINNQIKKLFLPYSDEVSVDNLGSVISVKKCGIENPKKILIEAHIDEIGLIVRDIDKNGFLTFVNVGGVDPRILPSAEVIIHGKKDIKGVIGAKPPHLADGREDKATKIKDMAIDTGLTPEEVRENISIGDSITLSQSVGELGKEQISLKTLDDRAGIAVLIEVMKRLDKEDICADVYAVAAVREEVGGYGAMTSAQKIMPDVAIAIDVCHGVTPDNSYSAYEIGSGCIVTCGPNIHPKIFDRLIQIAKKHEIKTEIDVDGGNTGTDAWVMQVVGEGIPTGLLSIPLKYMHTSVETAAISDIEATIKLLTEFIKSFDSNTEGWLCL